MGTVTHFDFTSQSLVVGRMSQDEDESTRAQEKVQDDTKADEKKGKFDFLKKMSVEPCIALFGLGWSLFGVQASTLYIQKTCKVGSFFFGNQTFSIETCDNLFNGSFEDEQKIVQATTAKIEIVSQILRTIPMVIFALFLGPWSDKAGRKLLIMLPLIGESISTLSYIVNVYFFDELVVEFLWFDAISSYFGGWTLVYIGAYGYIADTTSMKSRTVRIAVTDGTAAVTRTVGNFINPYIYAALGYYGSFGLGAACHLLAGIVAFFTIKNRKNPDYEGSKTKLFDLKNVLESFKVLTKPRPENMRHIVIILVVCFQIMMLGLSGAYSVEYLYIRRKFDFSDENTLITFYSQLGSFNNGIHILSMFIILPILVKFFKLHDISIVMLASVCAVLRAIVFCFATNLNILYTTLCLALFDNLLSQPLRSSLTKIVGSADVGKVFAAVGSLQAVMGFASPIFNIIYINTLDFYVGSVYLVVCGIFVVLLALLGYTYCFLRKVDSRDNIALISVTKSENT